MTRVERIELTRKLLDAGRLSDLAIADCVKRSKRWVRNIARQYPRSRTIQTVDPPTPRRNAATALIDEPPQRVRAVRRRLRPRGYPNQWWRWADRIGCVVIAGLYIFAAWRGDLGVRNGRLVFQAGAGDPRS